MSKNRRSFSDEFKANVVRRHVAKQVPVSDNGPQFIANDLTAFIRIQGLTHVRTAPY